jgi:hypothetical protein
MVAIVVAVIIVVVVADGGTVVTITGMTTFIATTINNSDHDNECKRAGRARVPLRRGKVGRRRHRRSRSLDSLDAPITQLLVVFGLSERAASVDELGI